MTHHFLFAYRYFVGSSNEVSNVLTEIAKVDPNFDKIEWLRFCEKEVIPNILEAFIRGDLKILEDWCHERAFIMLSAVVKEYQKSLFSTADSRIIDISKVEMVSGKMMDQGPVIVITFQVFMINVVKNKEGKVIQGDPVSLFVFFYFIKIFTKYFLFVLLF